MYEAHVIPRRVFDFALVSMAVGAGASFIRNQVTGLFRGPSGAVQGVTGRGGGFAASAVIAADGWGSTVARSLLGAERARPAQTGIAIRCYVDGVTGLRGRLSFFHDADLLPGCGWVFPLGENRANVGLGVLAPESGGPRLRLPDRLHAMMHDAMSPSAAMFSAATCIGDPITWPLALGWRRAPVAFDGVLLAGDAASLVSPLSGSGIAAALHSGRLAGETVLRALACGEFSRSQLAGYERAVRRRNRLQYALERGGQRLIRNPRRFDVLASWGVRAPYGQAAASYLLFNLG
jgi:flavin-dependent dehydrogenase